MKFKAIAKNREFLKGYKKGQSFVSPLIVTYVLKNRYGYTRIGITASKKTGNAVKRNRSRRVIRESLRSLNMDMTQSVDIILVARGKTPFVKCDKVAQQLKIHLQQSGLLP